MGAALRRLVVLIVAVAGATAVASLLVGALFGASLNRSLALGFYVVGCILMIGGFFVGNRGPARVRSDSTDAGESAMFPFVVRSTRRLRWATLPERDEAINQSAVFVALGLLLVLIGVLVDSRHALI